MLKRMKLEMVHLCLYIPNEVICVKIKKYSGNYFRFLLSLKQLKSLLIFLIC